MKNIINILVLVLCLTLTLTACGRTPSREPASESQSSGSAVSEPAVSPGSVPPPAGEVLEEGPESKPAESVNENSQSAAVSEILTAPEVQAENPFKVGKDEIYDLYLYSFNQRAYRMLESYFYSPRPEPDHPIVEVLNGLPELPKGALAVESQPDTGILIIREGYQKTQINLYENALKVDDDVYALTAEQYDTLKKLIDKGLSQTGDYVYSAQWLVWMNPNRVTGIECTDENGRTFQIKKENLSLAAIEPRYIGVQDGKAYTQGGKNFSTMKNTFRTVITFDSGVTYTMVFEKDNLYLESSDMSIACQYKVWNNAESFISAMKDAETGIMNPRTAKPVIYLYPEKTRDVSVRLNFRGRISYTYPAYNGGWDVIAAPDGTLTNKSDGSTHYYLFWDGHADFRDWDFSEGFLVKGNEATGFLKEKLPAMGLTPREYNDFITYWAPELSRNEYNLITFSIEQYQAIARLDITPTPDTVLRVHMVYKPVPAPVFIKEQIMPEAPKRNGFTVVEWGGTKA